MGTYIASNVIPTVLFMLCIEIPIWERSHANLAPLGSSSRILLAIALHIGDLVSGDFSVKSGGVAVVSCIGN